MPAMLPSILAATAVMAAGGAPTIETLKVVYTDNAEGHFAFGKAIGERFAEKITTAWAGDKEFAWMEDYVKSGQGKKRLENFVADSNATYPLYTLELEGMAAGSGIPLHRLLVNQLREELSQWMPDELGLVKRAGKCTTVFAYDPDGGVSAIAHTDDWTLNWRSLAYVLEATVLDEAGDVKLNFVAWGYPGYLPGEDIGFNSHGVAYSGNSLYPKKVGKRGLGTAWVSRDILEATSASDFRSRASPSTVSSGMAWNYADIPSKKMWNIEVNSFGTVEGVDVTGPYFQANQFLISDTKQWGEKSSNHRLKRWNELKPNTVDGLKAYISDTHDARYPVYRNATAPDDCYTEISAVFDFEAGTLSYWSTAATAGAPQLVYDLHGAGLSAILV